MDYHGSRSFVHHSITSRRLLKISLKGGVILKTALQPGHVFKNGATLLLAKTNQDEDAPNTVYTVLCVYEGTFVTWDYYKSDGHCKAGDYFGTDLKGAIQGFEERK